MPRILVFADYYLPSFRGGGPIRSLTNLVQALGEEFEFFIVTRDRDKGDAVPHPGVLVGTWMRVGKACVRYLSPYELTLHQLARIYVDTPHDAVYLNSLLSPQFAIKPLLAWHLHRGRRPLVIAPRGELHPGALRIKWAKKRLFLIIGKAAGLFRPTVWHATSGEEEQHIRQVFGDHVNVVVAPNIPLEVEVYARSTALPRKRPGHLRAVYLSRISPKKNLLEALRLLREVRGSVDFHIYGPVDDESYWLRCLSAIRDLPATVSVEYRGALDPAAVHQTLSQYHLFVLPTFGENFGYAILEALQAGCPVLITDQTPWRGLASHGAGWDLPLGNRNGFVAAIQTCIDMDEEAYRRMSENAKRFASRYAMEDAVFKHRELFLTAVAGSAARAG